MRPARAPAEHSAALVLLALVFPGIFLPIDVMYGAGGVMAYATPGQAAWIYLYALALSLLASAILCLLCAALGARATFAARWLGVSLVAFAIGHGLLLWSSYYVSYLAESRWLRMLVLLAVSAAIGWFAAWRGSARHFATLAAGLRACVAAVALGALVACGTLALNPPRSAAAPAPARSATDKPSIFLITIDTLAALHMSLHGYARTTTPRLSELGSGATVFARNYASSNFTTASVASMLFGDRPWAHRVTQLEARPPERLFAHSLPALLAASGYLTAAVATNSWASPRHLGIERQFELFSDHQVCLAADPVHALDTDLQTAIYQSLVWRELASLITRVSDALGTCAAGQFDPELALAQARRALASTPGNRPLFLWVHLFPPHDPYVTPAPFLGAFNPSDELRDRTSTIPPNQFEAADRMDFPGLLKDRYDESIRLVDHHVGRFLDELRARGRYDDAIIVVSADHGESFTKGYGQHGGPLLHEELVRIPLLIKTPGQRAPHTVVHPTELVDLKPTLLELAGIRAETPGEGISLVPLMQGHSPRRPVFTMNFQQSRRLGALERGSVAMIEGRWKYVHYFGAIHYPRMPRLRDALYDVEADPWEATDLSAAQPALAARMRGEIETRLRRHGAAIE